MCHMTAPTACPCCGHGELTSGVIVGRSPGVKFKASQGFAGDLTGILLTDGFFNHQASALRCEACGAVVVLPRS
jgi:hypothetical protein